MAILVSCHGKPVEQNRTNNWRDDWTIKENFYPEIDSTGYNFPTSIAFVPQPGKAPKDPLYFVTELRGKVKVVTNDRSIYTFSENSFRLTGEQELPDQGGEFGMAGVCLAPARGYVFVTFAYEDADHVLRNNIIRFSSDPGKFSLKPRDYLVFTDVFSREQSGVSHQIGTCRVVGDTLYVGTGDGNKSFASQRQDSLLGKVLRMTLDGKPVRDNPFYKDDDVHKARNFVFATGLRNPFAIATEGGRIFVGDNGNRIDRFLEIEPGQDYMWSGNDLSIGSFAAAVFSPSVGPVQMDYYSGTPAVLPAGYNQHFFLAVSGRPNDPGVENGKGVLSFQYDFAKKKMSSVPEYIVQYRGSGFQAVAGTAVGQDGLYFVPLFPVSGENSAIVKLVYKAGYEHPFSPDYELAPDVLMSQKACLECHSMEESRKKVGPPLEQKGLVARVAAQLNSEEYRKRIQEVDRIDQPPYRDFAGARQSVLKTKDIDQVRLWIKYHILEPRFDNPKAQMPNLGLTEEQADVLASYLTANRDSKGIFSWMEAFLDRTFWKFKYRSVAHFAFGFAVAIFFLISFVVIRPLFSRKS